MVGMLRPSGISSLSVSEAPGPMAQRCRLFLCKGGGGVQWEAGRPPAAWLRGLVPCLWPSRKICKSELFHSARDLGVEGTEHEQVMRPKYTLP